MHDVTAFLLAHLSDPHLGPLPPARARELLGKRAIGYINWQRKRHAVHRRDVLAALVADLHAQHPDHIAITGDLVNIALPAEFAQAAAWLKTIGPPRDVSLVPGNHDAYALSTRRQFAQAWSDYLQGDEPIAAVGGFPYLRRRGPLALIGVSSAVPTLPLMATGRVGPEQTERTAALLDRARDEGLIRVILIHHPPYVGGARRSRELIDAAAFEAMLKRHGADLVLHGHNHTFSLAWRAGPQRDFPIVGVPSASIGPRGHGDLGTWHLFRIDGDAGSHRIVLEQRGFELDGTVILRQAIDLSGRPA